MLNLWFRQGSLLGTLFQKRPPEVFCKKCVLRNLAKFIGKHPCKSYFFNKIAGLRPATLLKKRLWHRRFPVNTVKFLRTPFLQNTSGLQLLAILSDFNQWLIRWFNLKQWHIRWFAREIIFNRDPLKQAQETIFSSKIKQIIPYSLFFSHNLVNSTSNWIL